MPELPEVEVVTRSLKKTIKNLKIIKITVNNRNLRFKLPKNFKDVLKNKIIKNIKRKSKYIVFDLGNHFYVILHLGMSGTLHIPSKKNITNLSFYNNPILPKKHNHVEIQFNNLMLVYNDPRRFGYILFINSKTELLKKFEKFGPEPFSKNFTINYVKAYFRNKKKKY